MRALQSHGGEGHSHRSQCQLAECPCSSVPLHSNAFWAACFGRRNRKQDASSAWPGHLKWLWCKRPLGCMPWLPIPHCLEKVMNMPACCRASVVLLVWQLQLRGLGSQDFTPSVLPFCLCFMASSHSVPLGLFFLVVGLPPGQVGQLCSSKGCLI